VCWRGAIICTYRHVNESRCTDNGCLGTYGSCFLWDVTHSHVLTWLNYMCDTTYSYVRHDPFTCVDMTQSHMWYERCICVTWLLHCLHVPLDVLRDVTSACVLLWLIHMCWRDAFKCLDVTQSYVWHDVFICVTWLFLALMCLYSVACGTWLIHMCDVTRLYNHMCDICAQTI